MWQVMTLEGWAEKADVLVFEHNLPWAAFFFVSYIFIASIIMTNVVVAILLEKYLESTDNGKGHTAPGQASLANRNGSVPKNAVAPVESTKSIAQINAKSNAANMAALWKNKSASATKNQQNMKGSVGEENKKTAGTVNGICNTDLTRSGVGGIEQALQFQSVANGAAIQPSQHSRTRTRGEMISWLSAQLSPSQLRTMDPSLAGELYSFVSKNVKTVSLEVPHPNPTQPTDLMAAGLLGILHAGLR
jgi:hypothetical protein